MTFEEPDPGPTPEDMESRLSSAQDWYQNFIQFEQDIARDRDTALERIDQQVAYGSLAASAGEAARAAVEQDFTTRTEELRTGPTYQLLQSEFEAQREFALAQLEPEPVAAPVQPGGVQYREATGGGDPSWEGYQEPTAAGFYQTQEGGEGGPTEVYLGETNPYAAPPPPPGPTPEQMTQAFPYSSPEEFFKARFGEQAQSTQRAPTDALRSDRSPAAGASSPAGIGVGQVYSWY